MIKLYLTILVFAIANLLSAQNMESLAFIDRQDLKEIVETLASKEFYGRHSGTAGQKKAAEYIAGKYKSLGLRPMVRGSYYQKFKLNRQYWNEVYIEVDGKKLNNFEEIIYFGHDSINTEKQFELVFAGDGSGPLLNQIDVKGKMALVFSNSLRRDGYTKSDSLTARGAIGVIFVNPDNDAQFTTLKNTLKRHVLSPRYSLTEDTSRYKDDIIRFWASNFQVKRLVGMSSKVLSKKIKQGNIKGVPVKTVSLKCRRANDLIETENVIGFLPGKTDSSIIVTAHYDHLGGAEKYYYPGADDNASGVAAMLEVAEAFSMKEKPNCNIVFMATTAEELGLFGSKYFADDLLFKASKIALNINLDMLGRTDKEHNVEQTYVYSIGTEYLRKYKGLMQEAKQEYKNAYFDYSQDKVKDISGLFHRADQYSFYKKGVPAIFFTSGLHADYHKTTDKATLINYKLLENRTELIFMAIDIMQMKMFGNN